MESIYHPDYVRGLFNRMSGSYERMNYITSFGFSHRWRRQCLQHLSVAQHIDLVNVIDLMSGMGETWSSIFARFPRVQLTALDFSPGMLRQAVRRNQQHYHNRVQIEEQDMLNNSLADGCYDIVVCAYGLKTFNTEQLAALATETRRILKPGGQFVFVDVSQPADPFLYSLYAFYLRRIIPVLGRLMLGDPIQYQMLWTYTCQFGNATTAAELFRSTGLCVTNDRYFGGCATGFHGHRPTD